MASTNSQFSHASLQKIKVKVFSSYSSSQIPDTGYASVIVCSNLSNQVQSQTTYYGVSKILKAKLQVDKLLLNLQAHMLDNLSLQLYSIEWFCNSFKIQLTLFVCDSHLYARVHWELQLSMFSLELPCNNAKRVNSLQRFSNPRLLNSIAHSCKMTPHHTITAVWKSSLQCS